MKNRIVIVGNTYMQFSMRIAHVHAAFQKIESDDYEYRPHGSGFLNAVNLQSLGNDAILCTKIGADQNGRLIKQYCAEKGVDTRFMRMVDYKKTGLLSLTTDGVASRTVCYSGANSTLNGEDIESVFTCYPDAVYMKCDLDFSILADTTKMAWQKNIPVFLDAAEVNKDFVPNLLYPVKLFAIDDRSLTALTGIVPSDLKKCLSACVKLETLVKADHYLLTMGSRGVFLYDGTYHLSIPSYDTEGKIKATSDAFLPVVVTKFLENGNLSEACRWGEAADALAGIGRNEGNPYRLEDIYTYFENHKNDMRYLQSN